MKRWLVTQFLFFAICTSNVALAQAYIPFPSDSAVWSNTVNSLEFSLDRFIMSGDTFTNGYLFHKIFRNKQVYDPTNSYDTTLYLFAIREENKRIYWVGHSSGGVRLLYDFNIGVNDSVQIFNATNSQSITMNVDSVDSVLIYDAWHRRLKFNQGPVPHNSEYWIEGIGSTFGLMYPFESLYDLSTNLYCMQEKGVNKYYDSLIVQEFSEEEPFSCDGYDSLPKYQPPFTNKLYPNPTASFITLEFSEPAFSIQIFDCTGRSWSIISELNTTSATINVSTFAAGIYIAMIQHRFYYQVEKFVKQ